MCLCLLWRGATQVDMAERRVVPKPEAEALQAANRLFAYEECSAKTQENVKVLFHNVAQALADMR